MKPRVYFAGPIAGLDYKGATDWREVVAKQLAPDILALSPMRGKDYLAAYTDIGGTPGAMHAMNNAMSTPAAIVTRDRNDTTKSDAVLMNLLGAKKVSIGTMIEAGWADAARVPIVLVIEPDNIHQHAMLIDIAGYIVPTLDEAVHILKAFLGGRSVGVCEAYEEGRKTGYNLAVGCDHCPPDPVRLPGDHFGG